MFSQPEMTVIPVFWIRILWTRPKTFIFDPILQQSLRVRVTTCRLENWILMVQRESNPGK